MLHKKGDLSGGKQVSVVDVSKTLKQLENKFITDIWSFFI